MIIIPVLTAIFLLIYLAYPLWLSFFSVKRQMVIQEAGEAPGVSLILLSCNGKTYLDDKINFLLSELAAFKNFELIIVDDFSDDGSIRFLKKYESHDHVRLFFNSCRRGIPYCMNLGVRNAKYGYLIFCDQRQRLSAGIIKRIVEPLACNEIGAVSGCISCRDKCSKTSFLRRHENIIKLKESNAGSLMGVYGPFYALKKQCYCPLPENIILDDLYLSLRILKSHRIILLKDCEIIDDNFTALYNYRRSKRYLEGLLQIVRSRTLIRDLGLKHRIMLVWHKYLRLMLPFFLLATYVYAGLKSFAYPGVFTVFSVLTVFMAVSVLPAMSKTRFRRMGIIRVNIYYIVAFADLLIIRPFQKWLTAYHPAGEAGKQDSYSQNV
ncbi:MAG: glycosyltransferase [Bacteroidales bacterium]|nr:glycosyltransferase [Bacteroidales bacterium]